MSDGMRTARLGRHWFARQRLDPYDGDIVTFYSSESSTLRTNTLVHTARGIADSLPSDVHPVLLVDFDLTSRALSRGMERSDDDHPSTRRGTLELFEALQAVIAERVKDSPNARLDDEACAAIVATIDLENYVNGTSHANVFVMHAGNVDESYAQRVSVLDVKRLFELAPGIYRALAQYLSRVYGFVFIDAPSGRSNMSGVCVMLLPDALVVLPGEHDGNTIQLDMLASAYRDSASDERPLRVYPLWLDCLTVAFPLSANETDREYWPYALDEYVQSACVHVDGTFVDRTDESFAAWIVTGATRAQSPKDVLSRQQADLVLERFAPDDSTRSLNDWRKLLIEFGRDAPETVNLRIERPAALDDDVGACLGVIVALTHAVRGEFAASSTILRRNHQGSAAHNLPNKVMRAFIDVAASLAANDSDMTRDPERDEWIKAVHRFIDGGSPDGHYRRIWEDLVAGESSVETQETSGVKASVSNQRLQRVAIEIAKIQLEAFGRVTPGVVAAVLLSADGFELASLHVDKGGAARLAAMSSSLSAIGSAIAKEAGIVDCRRAIVEGDGGTVVVMSVPDADPPISLAIVAGDGHMLGQMLWEARKCCYAIGRALSERTDLSVSRQTYGKSREL